MPAQRRCAALPKITHKDDRQRPHEPSAAVLARRRREEGKGYAGRTHCLSLLCSALLCSAREEGYYCTPTPSSRHLAASRWHSLLSALRCAAYQCCSRRSSHALKFRMPVLEAWGALSVCFCATYLHTGPPSRASTQLRLPLVSMVASHGQPRPGSAGQA
jgi:hypothetical protein